MIFSSIHLDAAKVLHVTFDSEDAVLFPGYILEDDANV